MEDIVMESLLFDFYGNLLTEKMRRVTELYHEDNLSLSEIAEQEGISRSAVHDSLKSAEKRLSGYEEKLGLVRRFVETEAAARKILRLTEEIQDAHAGDAVLERQLREIRSLAREISR